ncbi:hypothetical protein [Lacinutrix sp. MEBiC02595]
MKNLKLITSILCIALFSLLSCQDEIDNENGENPNTNSADSQTADNLTRTSMFDGSFDDFLDGVSCSSILLPVTATINGTSITILNEVDYTQVLNILGQFNTDEDTVVLQFPLTVSLSNYTEVVVTSQGEYDALVDACEAAEAAGEAAISCLDIEFPITVLTYSLSLEQTGSVVLESEQQLYAYMNGFSDDELFSISYPIDLTFTNGTSTTVSSDSELQASINDCVNEAGIIEDAEDEANTLEVLLVDGLFQVDSFVIAGVNTATDYVEYTIDFANDLSLVAENIVNTTSNDVQGTYEVTSQTEVFLNLNFTGNATFSLLNQEWQVTSYSNTTIELQSSTNAAITLVLTQV